MPARWRRGLLARGDRAARDRRHARKTRWPPISRGWAGPASGRRPVFYSVAVHSGELTLAPDEYASSWPACMLALNGEPARPRAGRAGAPDGRTPWPPPRLSRPRRPWLRRIRKRQRSKRRLRQPRRLSSRLNPAAPARTPAVAASRVPGPRNPALLRQPRRNPQALPPWFRRRGSRPSLPPRPSLRRKAAWEELPDAAPAAVKQGAAALAVTPAASAVTAPAPAQDEPDGPPSWVDEEIPYEPKAASCRTAASRPIRMTNSRWARRHRPVRRERRPRASASPAPHRRHDAGLAAAGLPVTGLAAELARRANGSACRRHRAARGREDAGRKRKPRAPADRAVRTFGQGIR